MVSMGLEGLIDPERLVVVAPNAVAGQWNDGRLLAATLTWEADDVAFIRGLIGYLVDTGVSDPHRVYRRSPRWCRLTPGRGGALRRHGCSWRAQQREEAIVRMRFITVLSNANGCASAPRLSL